MSDQNNGTVARAGRGQPRAWLTDVQCHQAYFYSLQEQFILNSVECQTWQT